MACSVTNHSPHDLFKPIPQPIWKQVNSNQVRLALIDQKSVYTDAKRLERVFFQCNLDTDSFPRLIWVNAVAHADYRACQTDHCISRQPGKQLRVIVNPHAKARKTFQLTFVIRRFPDSRWQLRWPLKQNLLYQKRSRQVSGSA